MKSQQKQELDGIIDKIIGYFRFHDRKERDDETDMWERINREIRQQEKKTRVREYIKRFLIPVSVPAIDFCCLIVKGNIQSLTIIVKTIIDSPKSLRR